VLLNFKGFQAIQVHRLANQLWIHGRKDLALFIQSRNSEVFSVDIHPAAKIGQAVMFDHATGIVVGETAIIHNNVSIMQSVTLGGTGNEAGDRHPKVLEGVMIGAGAKILGNITIGEGAKIGAGSVVLNNVPAHVTVAGIPAKIVGKPSCQKPCETMQQNILED
jgi:serine O-acetyltransferase